MAATIPPPVVDHVMGHLTPVAVEQHATGIIPPRIRPPSAAALAAGAVILGSYVAQVAEDETIDIESGKAASFAAYSQQSFAFWKTGAAVLFIVIYMIFMRFMNVPL